MMMIAHMATLGIAQPVDRPERTERERPFKNWFIRPTFFSYRKVQTMEMTTMEVTTGL